MTYHVTADYAHQNFDEIIQRTSTNAEGIVITLRSPLHRLCRAYRCAYTAGVLLSASHSSNTKIRKPILTAR